MAFKLLDGATAIGASPAIKVGKNVIDHTCDVKFTSLAATAISALTVVLQGASTNEHAVTGPITNPTLAIGSTAEQWKTGTFYYRINNTNYSKATVAAGAAFSAAHAVTAEKYGVVLCFINAAGTVSTKVVSATQAYTTAALAHTAADAYLPTVLTSDLCYIGRILINAESGNDWNANTDDLTNGSDLTTATFLSEPITFMDLGTNAFSAGEITAMRAMWHTPAKNVRYVRLFVSALTGTGEIDGWYTPAY